MLWKTSNDLGESLFEAEIEEAVGFVEDKCFEGVGGAVDVRRREEVIETPGSADDKVGGLFQEVLEVMGRRSCTSEKEERFDS